jgi:hypothetical protein
MGRGKATASGTAGKPTAKKATKNAPAKKPAGRKPAAKTQPTEGEAFVCKMGESQVGVTVKSGETLYDMLKRAVFPRGTFKTKAGTDITNLIAAAEQDVAQGQATSVAACFQDLRVDGMGATLETPIKPGVIVTLVPKITGG